PTIPSRIAPSAVPVSLAAERCNYGGAPCRGKGNRTSHAATQRRGETPAALRASASLREIPLSVLRGREEVGARLGVANLAAEQGGARGRGEADQRHDQRQDREPPRRAVPPPHHQQREQ